MFNFENYKGKNVCIHCKTEEEVENLCDELNKAGLKWVTGDPYDAKNFGIFNRLSSDSVLYFNLGRFGDLMDVDKDCKILEWSDYMNKNFTKQDLKTGDVCVLRNQEVLITIIDLNCFVSQYNTTSIDNYNDDLSNVYTRTFDIMNIYRPKLQDECSFDANDYGNGEHVFEREDNYRLTLEDIKQKLGLDKLEIIDKYDDDLPF